MARQKKQVCKKQNSQEEHIFREKLTTEKDIDEDVLVESFKRNENNSLKILIGIYRGQYFKLFLSVLFFAVKHSPVWVLPIATANIINIATNPDGDALRNICINAGVMIALIVQNVPTNYFHVYCYSKVIRNVECRLRSAMVRKLQIGRASCRKEC